MQSSSRADLFRCLGRWCSSTAKWTVHASWACFRMLSASSVTVLIFSSDIHRAWITVDNKLFLWNYEDGYYRSHTGWSY
jgi:hypothetical protein